MDFVNAVLGRKLLGGKAGRCGELLDKSFPHTVPLVGVVCVCMCLSLCTCVSACLLCGSLYLFVILDEGWLGWLVGSWEGLSCWRFQIEPGFSRAQLLETVTFLAEI